MVSTVVAGDHPPCVHMTIRTHLESRHVTQVIYGSIIGLALIVAVEKHPPGPGTMIAWLIGTALSNSPVLLRRR